jgi:hypothetical protein
MFAGASAWSSLLGSLKAQSPSRGEPAPLSAYARAVLASGPAAYRRLDELRGPTAHVASGKGNSGRYVGRPQFGQKGAFPSETNRAVGLPGHQTRSYVEIPSREAFSIGSSGKGLTVEVWMRPDALDFKGEDTGPAGDFIHWLGEGEEGRYEWGFRFYGRRSSRPNRISAYAWNSDGKLGAGAYVEDPVVAGAWIYLVATFDDPRTVNAKVNLYKNGAPGLNNQSPGTLYKDYHISPKHGAAPLRLGTRDLRSFLKGGLDEVAIYPRVLKAEEILHRFQVASGEGQRSSRSR